MPKFTLFKTIKKNLTKNTSKKGSKASSKVPTVLKKKKIKTLSIYAGIVLTILAPVIYLTLQKTEQAAAWWDDVWQYRVAYTISGSADSNKKIKLDIDTSTLISAGKMQSDCGDSRFTNANGALLKYFIDTAGGACNTASTDYYVLVDTFYADDTTVYHYYGNPSAANGTEASSFSQDTYTPSGTSAGSEELSKGPVSYWKFDEGQGSTTYDAMGRNNVTLGSGSSAPQWKSGSECITGNCLAFDGSNDTAIIPYSSDLNLTTGLTLSAWIKPTTQEVVIVGKPYAATHTSPYFDWVMFYTNAAGGTLNFRIGSTTNGSNSQIPLNEWVHVAVTADGTYHRWYINGTLDKTISSATLPTNTNSQNIRIGSNASNGEVFNGTIDDVKVYPYARTAAEIQNDYINSSSSQGASATTVAKNDGGTLSDGLVGYWKMDESSGNASDSSGLGTTLTNNATATFASGKYGNATDLESSSEQYFSATSTTALSISSDLTLSAWINPESTTSSTQFDIIGKWEEADTDYMFAQYGDELRLYLNSASNYVESTNANLATSTFYHVTAVYNATDQSIKLYKNGVELSTTTTGTIPSSINTSSSTFFVGSEISASPYLYTYKDGSYEFVSDMLGGLTSKEEENETVQNITSRVSVENGKIKLKLTEELDEITYFNNVYLRVDGKEIRSIASLSNKYQSLNSASLDKDDDEYFTLVRGQEVLLEFLVPEDFTKLEFITKGYYVPNDQNDLLESEYLYPREKVSIERGRLVDSLFSEYEDKSVLITNDGDDSQIETEYYSARLSDAGIKFTDSTEAIQLDPVALNWDQNTFISANKTSNKVIDDSSGDVSVNYSDVLGQGVDLNYKFTKDTMTKDVVISDKSKLGNIPHYAKNLEMVFELKTDKDILIGGKLWNGNETIVTEGLKIGEHMVIPQAKAMGDDGEITVSLRLWQQNGQIFVAKQIPVEWIKKQSGPIRADLTITLDGATTFESGSTYDTSVVAMDSTYFVVAYRDGDDSNKGKVIAGSVSDTTITITLDGATEFDSVGAYEPEVGALDSTNFVIAYRNYAGFGQPQAGQALVGSISGTSITISADSATSFNADTSNYISLAVMDSTHFVVAYRDVGNSNKGTVVAASVSGTTITYGSENEFESGSTAHMGITSLDSTYFAISFADQGDSNKGKVIAGSISGTTITISLDGATTFESGATSITAIDTLDSTHFVIVFRDGGDGDGKAIVGTTSGTTITISLDGGTTFASVISSFGYLSVLALDESRFIAVYPDNSDGDKGKIANGSVSGTAITIDSTTTFESGGTYYISNTLLDPSHFVITFRDQSDGTKGKIIVGEEPLPPGPRNLYDGLIDEVRVYNRALNPTEVTQLYNFAPGPVAYWTMDEGSGTSLYDSSGNENNSSAWGGNTSWVTGKYGSATSHDGSGDRITIPSSATLDYLPAYTFSLWLKPEDGSSVNIIDKQVDTNDGWGITVNSNKFQFVVNYTGTDLACTSPDPDVDAQQWQHIAFTWDGTNTCSGVKYYKNGSLATFSSTQDATGTREDDSGKDILIGGNGYTDYDGEIDDFKIYNYVRTQSQILNDLNAGHPNVGTPVGSTVLHLKMDEGYGSTAYDSSPQGNDGTISSATWTNSGRFGKALDFASASDNYVEVTNDASLDSLQQITLSTWIYADSYGESSGGRIIEKNGASDDGFSMWINGTTWESVLFSAAGWDGTAGQWRGPSGAIQTGQWYHIVLTYDYSSLSNDAQFYINGDAVTTTETIAPTGSFATESNDIRIGANYQTPPIREFDGKIDEVKIYPFILTEEEVRLDYNHGKLLTMGAGSTESDGTTASNSAARAYCIPGDTSTCNAPIAEWNFDEKTGTSANDTSGGGNTGTLGVGSSAPSWTSGKYGNALSFDGNDFVSAGDMSEVDFGSGNFTLSFWVKLSSLTQTRAHFIAKDIAGARQFDLVWDSGNNNGNDIRIDYFKSGEVDVYGRTATNIITDTNWHHVVAGRNGSSFFFYIDGEYKAIAASGGTHGSMQATSTAVTIGKRLYSGFEEPIEGVMDQVRIYDYARTSAQVAWEYNQGAPIAHYKFDECEGTTINDWGPNSSGGFNGNNGTLTIGGSGTQTSVGTCASSGVWANGETGQNNSSMSFDGTDDYVTIADDDIFTFGNGTTDRPFSISAWVYVTDNNQATILSKYEETTGSPQREFDFYLNSSGYLTMLVEDESAGGYISRNWATAFPENEWHYVSAVYDGSGTNSGIKIYVDGQQKDDTNAGSGTFNAIQNTSSDLEIGRNISSGGGNTYLFSGQIDDVKIFNYALTQDQIQTDMAGGAVSFR